MDGIVPKIIINKPKSLNSLNLSMVKELSKLMKKIEKYPVFWVEGAGGKAFCAGGDVKVLYEGNANAELR
jgi:3-hydroxyisobutyryl-CoA hydrolase